MSSPDAQDALCRTAQLLRLDVFESTPEQDADVVAGLRSTTVRLIADRRVVSSVGGQTALVTLYSQLAMTGLRVDLDVPEVELLAPQPPVRGDHLVAGLLDLGADLIPGGAAPASERPDLVIAFGNVPAHGGDVRVTWTDDRALAVPGGLSLPTPDGDLLPFGAAAAGAMAAAEGVRAAIPVIATALGVPVPDCQTWRNPGTRQMEADLGDLVAGLDRHIGTVDVVSAGAITTACLYTLLRIPRLTGSLRIVDNDQLDISNLNRYPLARRSLVGHDKVDVLAEYSNTSLRITGESLPFSTDSLPGLHPLAAKVLIGVDVIPTRWTIQKQYMDATVHVGSTSHDFVLVSDHRPGSPCAGCVHPKDDADVQGPIPTIGFVSLWAGLVQAARLMAQPVDGTLAVEIWPLGLEHTLGVRRYAPAAHPRCPVGCPASRSDFEHSA